MKKVVALGVAKENFEATLFTFDRFHLPVSCFLLVTQNPL